MSVFNDNNAYNHYHYQHNDPPAAATYAPMFAALSSLPSLQELRVLLVKPSSTSSTVALPFLDAFSHLVAQKLTRLDVDVRVNQVTVPSPRCP